MLAWGIGPNGIAEIVERVSTEGYSGNVELFAWPHKVGLAQSFRLKVKDSRGEGARRGASGRRTVAACFHAHRDVMAAIFALNDRARIKSAMADYRSRDDFEANFPATGQKNAGSMMQPVAFARSQADCSGTR